MCLLNNSSNPVNHPAVVWGACFLWLISMFYIFWSLLLFFCIGDILLLTGTDMINAFVLLSGVSMLPANTHMLYCIAHGIQILPGGRVTCCPLWLYSIWIIIVNVIGIILCIQRMATCKLNVLTNIESSMHQYRTSPLHKHFMDNIQWSLGCCGLQSYKDWFRHNWYDKIRDYEWEPSSHKRLQKNSHATTDSVPLSCCKSGSCISNYLTELGTYSIKTKGCHKFLYKVMMISMSLHIFVFSMVIVIQLMILRLIVKRQKQSSRPPEVVGNVVEVRHIMEAKNNFKRSSEESSATRLEETDESFG